MIITGLIPVGVEGMEGAGRGVGLRGKIREGGMGKEEGGGGVLNPSVHTVHDACSHYLRILTKPYPFG